MTKKQLLKRIEELEALVVSLNAAIAAMASKPIYVGPIPAAPTVNPLPFPQPYIADPPFLPYRPTITCAGGSLQPDRTVVAFNSCGGESAMGKGEPPCSINS